MNGTFDINLEWKVYLMQGSDAIYHKSFHGHRFDNPDRARFIARKNPGYDVVIINAKDSSDYYTAPAIHLQLVK